jgi:hypothetical protein
MSRHNAARAIRAVKIVVRDGRIPRPLRWGGAVGLAPVPGPFDEAVLLVVGAILWLFYRNQLREAWQKAETPRTADEPERLGEESPAENGDTP